jgi:hypothetical protein
VGWYCAARMCVESGKVAISEGGVVEGACGGVGGCGAGQVSLLAWVRWARWGGAVMCGAVGRRWGWRERCDGQRWG